MRNCRSCTSEVKVFLQLFANTAVIQSFFRKRKETRLLLLHFNYFLKTQVIKKHVIIRLYVIIIFININTKYMCKMKKITNLMNKNTTPDNRICQSACNMTQKVRLC